MSRMVESSCFVATACRTKLFSVRVYITCHCEPDEANKAKARCAKPYTSQGTAVLLRVYQPLLSGRFTIPLSSHVSSVKP